MSMSIAQPDVIRLLRGKAIHAHESAAAAARRGDFPLAARYQCIEQTIDALITELTQLSEEAIQAASPAQTQPTQEAA